MHFPLTDIIESVYDLIDLRAEISSENIDLDATIVIEFKKDGEQVAWAGKEFKWQLDAQNQHHIYHSIRCSHFIDKKVIFNN